jgi:hypothetical protein
MQPYTRQQHEHCKANMALKPNHTEAHIRVPGATKAAVTDIEKHMKGFFESALTASQLLEQEHSLAGGNSKARFQGNSATTHKPCKQTGQRCLA